MLGTLWGFQCQRKKCSHGDTYCTEIHSNQWRIYVYRHGNTRVRNLITHIQIPYPQKTTFINLFYTRPSWKMSCQPLRSRGRVAKVEKEPGSRGGAQIYACTLQQIATQLAHRLHQNFYL